MRELKVKGFFDDDDFEFRIKRIKITAPKTTSQKEHKIVYSRKNYFSFSSGYSPRNFKEIIVKNRGSSASIEKTTAHSIKHNTRTESKEPEHLLPLEYRLENEFWNCGKTEKEIFNDELKIWKANKTSNGGKTPKFENSRWEMIINLNHTHTLENAKEIANHIAQKFNFTATRIAIHRDEGYLKDLDNDITLILKDDKQGNKQNAWRDENTLKYYRNAEMTDEIVNIGVGYNYHAHLNFVTLKDAKQNMRRTHITARKLSDLQTEIAEMLQMERGEKVKNHENRRLSHKHYRATLRAMEQNDDFINKKELTAIIESIRKDNIGKGLKQDFFKELTAFKNELLKEKQVKIDDLQQKIDDFSKKFDIAMYDLDELKKKNDELKKENERLKAENLAQVQKIVDLEKSNAELKAELAKNRTETALKAQNEPLKDEITPKIEKSQNQLDLEFLKELRKGILNKKEVNALYGVFNRLEMITEKTKLNVFADTIATPYDDIEKAEKKLEKQLIIEQNEPKINEIKAFFTELANSNKTSFKMLDENNKIIDFEIKKDGNSKVFITKEYEPKYADIYFDVNYQTQQGGRVARDDNGEPIVKSLTLNKRVDFSNYHKLTFKKEPSIDEQLNFINQQNMKRYLEKQKQEIELKSKEKDKGREI